MLCFSYVLCEVNTYRVSTLAAVAIQNKMHVISHCDTQIFSHNYVRKSLFFFETLSDAQFYPEKLTFLHILCQEQYVQ